MRSEEAEKPEEESQSPEEAKSGGQTYVLNTSTKVFHYPSCGSVKKMKDKNKQISSDSREEIIASGYKPCGNCHP